MDSQEIPGLDFNANYAFNQPFEKAVLDNSVVSDLFAQDANQLLLAHLYNYLVENGHHESAKSLLQELNVPISAQSNGNEMVTAIMELDAPETFLLEWWLLIWQLQLSMDPKLNQLFNPSPVMASKMPPPSRANMLRYQQQLRLQQLRRAQQASAAQAPTAVQVQANGTPGSAVASPITAIPPGVNAPYLLSAATTPQASHQSPPNQEMNFVMENNQRKQLMMKQNLNSQRMAQQHYLQSQATTPTTSSFPKGPSPPQAHAQAPAPAAQGAPVNMPMNVPVRNVNMTPNMRYQNYPNYYQGQPQTQPMQMPNPMPNMQNVAPQQYDKNVMQFDQDDSWNKLGLMLHNEDWLGSLSMGP